MKPILIIVNLILAPSFFETQFILLFVENCYNIHVFNYHEIKISLLRNLCEHTIILERKSSGQCLADTFPFKDGLCCTDTLFCPPLLVLRGKAYKQGMSPGASCAPGNSAIPHPQWIHSKTANKDLQQASSVKAALGSPT